MNYATLSVRMQAKSRAELERIAKEQKCSLSHLMRIAANELIARNTSDASTPKKEEAHA
jgi:hypothetical protein